jgi:polysaccharide biosynthesis/export protein
MKFSIKNISLFLIFVVLFSSCASREKMVYMQNIDNQKNNIYELSFEPKLQSDDLLTILVGSENPELTVPFNLPQVQPNYEMDNNQSNIKKYLIDFSGNIDFPVIGKIKLAGLSKSEAKNLLVTKISEYIKKPTVNLEILNFKVSVIGEVAKPNSYNIGSDRITLLEAISLAGDLTVYGKRDNVLLIREVGGKRSYNRIDLTNADFINSPFYYLSQNDVVYVEPNKTKINSSLFGPSVSLLFSFAALFTTVIIILLKK